MQIEVTHNMWDNVHCYILHNYADWLSGTSTIILSKNICFKIQSGSKISQWNMVRRLGKRGGQGRIVWSYNQLFYSTDFKHFMMTNEERVRVITIIHWNLLPFMTFWCKIMTKTKFELHTLVWSYQWWFILMLGTKKKPLTFFFK